MGHWILARLSGVISRLRLRPHRVGPTSGWRVMRPESANAGMVALQVARKAILNNSGWSYHEVPGSQAHFWWSILNGRPLRNNRRAKMLSNGRNIRNK
jgi:hypothetical protein